jgi:outer membrane protein assembly factor BamE (lipoprotein component of BamABCDE complex)
MRLSLVILALLLLLLVSGCRTLYVLDKQDFYRITKGTQLGNTTIDRDGYFLSDLYMSKVVEMKVK